ncbi:MAG: CopD family protein [Gemmatimonadota bacterium]
MEWIIARWVTFTATVLALGACAVAVAVLPRVAADDAARRSLARDSATVGIGAALALIPASLMRLLDQLLALRSEGEPLLAGAGPLLTSTTWGTGFAWQSAATLLALTGFAFVRGAPTSAVRWLVPTLASVALCVTPALQGHAIGSETLTMLAVGADITHVAGAGLWLGAIGVMALLGTSLKNADGVHSPARAERADARLRLLVPLIPPVAIPGAALLLVSGTVATVLKLRAASDLWTETWGRYVLLKVSLVLVVLAFGALNWRRLGPRIAATDGVPALRKALITELLLALAVLLVTAILVVTPLPGEE